MVDRVVLFLLVAIFVVLALQAYLGYLAIRILRDLLPHQPLSDTSFLHQVQEVEREPIQKAPLTLEEALEFSQKEQPEQETVLTELAVQEYEKGLDEDRFPYYDPPPSPFERFLEEEQPQVPSSVSLPPTEETASGAGKHE